jgi:predicted nucleic-acid-binding protein
MCSCVCSSTTTKRKPLQHAHFDAQAVEDDSLWIADMVWAELVWALARSHDQPRADIVTAMRALVGDTAMKLESAASIVEGTTLYELGPADFVDGLLAVEAKAHSCTTLHGFDKKDNRAAWDSQAFKGCSTARETGLVNAEDFNSKSSMLMLVRSQKRFECLRKTQC